jgi:hypothetical protein
MAIGFGLTLAPAAARHIGISSATALLLSSAAVAMLGQNLAADEIALAGQSLAITCDGHADVTPLINAAVKKLKRGDAINLSPGICFVSSTITIPDGISLLGSGRGVTTIRSTKDPIASVIEVGEQAALSPSSDVTIAHLTVDGSATRRGPRRSSGIAVSSNSDKVTIHDTEVMNAGDNGIETSGKRTDIHNNYVHDNWTNGIYVIGFFDDKSQSVIFASRATIRENVVENNSRAGMLPAHPSWDGIDIDPMAEFCIVEGNVVIGNDIIIFEDGRHIPWSRGHRIANNLILRSPQNGIDLTGYIEDFQIVGNRILDTIYYGIFFNAPARRGIIDGNVISSTTHSGILIENKGFGGVPNDITISNNTISSPAESPGEHSGIAIRSSARNMYITQNQVIPGARGHMIYAVDAGDAQPPVMIFNNRLGPGLRGSIRTPNAPVSDEEHRKKGFNSYNGP